MTTLLKPGYLVSLKTSLRGGVTYLKSTTERDKREDNATIEKWDTTKIVDDPEEFERAKKVRSAATAAVRRICVRTSGFGLLCPESEEAKLDAAVEEARTLARAFNETAVTTRVRVNVIKGRIASTDEEATQAIASEVSELLEQMQQGIADADVEKIRDAANRAREVGQALDADAEKKVSAAVEEARSAARAIVRRIVNGGEKADLVVQELTRDSINAARFAFLDLEEKRADVEALPVDAKRFDVDVAACAPPTPDVVYPAAVVEVEQPDGSAKSVEVPSFADELDSTTERLVGKTKRAKLVTPTARKPRPKKSSSKKEAV